MMTPLSLVTPVTTPCLVRLLLFWQLRASDGRLLLCELCTTATGLELWCGYSEDDLLRTAPVEGIRAAMALAADWRAHYLALGGFLIVLGGHDSAV